MAASSPLNTQMASTLQSWRDRAIERSRVLTDGFEVALTWAGAIADWILFLCLVSNIVEVLAKLGGTPFSNFVMGTQSILLDIGGFALLTMAVHAHQRGARRTRNSAAFIGALLMLVTLATVVLITVGNLWPKAADQVQGINQGLILARIGMTIVYECTIHLLRHAEQQERHTQQAQVHQSFSEQVQALTETLNQQVVHLQQQLAESERRFELALNQITAQVQGVQSGAVQQVQALVQSTISEQVAGQIAEVTQGLKKEMHTVLTEARPGSATRKPGSSPASSARPASAPGGNITPLVQSPKSEPGSEPVKVRVPRFIQERLNQGSKPSLTEIMEQCECSRNTAIRYRRDLCGTDEEERSA